MSFARFTIGSVALLAGSSVALAQYGTPGQPQQGQEAQQRHQMLGQPGQEGVHQQMNSQEAERLVSSWGTTQQTTFKALSQKFGPPDAISSEAITWKDKGDYKKVSILKDSVQQLFPKPHENSLCVEVSCKVPDEKITDLIKFDNSITINKNRGVLAVESDTLEHANIALNLAHEIVTGQTQMEQAREQFAQNAQSLQKGQAVALAQSLQLRPDIAAGDPGQPARTFATPESSDQKGNNGGDMDRDKDNDKDNNGGGR